MKKVGDKYFNNTFIEMIKNNPRNQTNIANEIGIKLYTFNRLLYGKKPIKNEFIIDKICELFHVNESDIVYEYKPTPDYISEKEEWKSINDPALKDMYMVSNCGRIWSAARNQEMKQSQNKHGYLRLSLEVSGKTKEYKVHRLVAKTFIPNPLNLREVNHKDGNKTNNNINNLEWVTPKENVNHAYANNLHSNVRPIKVKETGEIYHTIKAFMDSYNVKSRSGTQKALKLGKRIKGVHIDYV